MNIDVLITIIGGIIAFAKWVYEYTKKNEWDKDKYLVDCIDNLREKDYVKCCEKILDWNAIEIFYKDTKIKVKDKSVYEALYTHDIKDKFTDSEVLIREIFDKYFDELTKLVILTKCNLVSEKNLVKFLSYWFDILNGNKKTKSDDFTKQIFTYLSFYGFDELSQFLIKLKK